MVRSGWHSSAVPCLCSMRSVWQHGTWKKRVIAIMKAIKRGLMRKSIGQLERHFGKDGALSLARWMRLCKLCSNQGARHRLERFGAMW